MSVSSSFPFEIAELFVQNLTDDGVALKACTLVCRQWNRMAREAQWSTRDLKFKMDDFESQEKYILLNEIWSAEVSTLPTALRRIQFEGICTTWGSLKRPLDYSDMDRFNQFIPTLTSKSPSIHTMTLLNVDLTWINLASLAALSSLQFLTSLSLLHIDLYRSSYLIQFCNNFKGLTSCNFNLRSRMVIDYDYINEKHESFARLRHIEMTVSAEMLMITKYLTHTPTFLQSLTLHWPISALRDFTAPAQLIRHTGQSLRRLKLDIGIDVLPLLDRDRPFPIDLSQNIGLIDATFGSILLDNAYDVELSTSHMFWLPQLLTTLSSPQLKILRLTLIEGTNSRTFLWDQFLGLFTTHPQRELWKKIQMNIWQSYRDHKDNLSEQDARRRMKVLGDKLEVVINPGGRAISDVMI